MNEYLRSIAAITTRENRSSWRKLRPSATLFTTNAKRRMSWKRTRNSAGRGWRMNDSATAGVRFKCCLCCTIYVQRLVPVTARSLRRRSSAVRLLRLWVRIPPGSWMYVMSVVCCKVEVSATDWSLVQRSPTDCGASLYVTKKPRKRGGYSPARGLQNTNPQWVVAPGDKNIYVQL